jgi:hypothetical protein
MTEKLNYATREPRREPLLPAIVVSLAGSALLSAVAAVIGCAAALWRWPSPSNLGETCVIGLTCGICGGGVVALFVSAVRSYPLLVSLVGVFVTSISVFLAMFCFVVEVYSR